MVSETLEAQPALVAAVQTGILSALEARQYLGHPLVKLVLLGFTWAFLHHLCAGIRYLFLDVHKGIDLPTARATSFVVFAASLLLTAVFGAKLW